MAAMLARRVRSTRLSFRTATAPWLIEGEIVLVVEGLVGLVVLAVDEEVEVELTHAKVRDDGGPGVDVEAKAVVVDEGEREEVNGGGGVGE
ncbi:hypothetical protein ACLB2K_063154 [Fragaria x ananassa]